jgi:hypothetical protein
MTVGYGVVTAPGIVAFPANAAVAAANNTVTTVILSQLDLRSFILFSFTLRRLIFNN